MFFMKCVLPLLAALTVTCLSFLLSLCVDVLLVCAEGCTQLTGVMAMMMTGRVLLVCALCVLWCGAATVVSTAPDATRAQSVWPEYLFLNWHELFRNECKVENPYENEDLKGLAVNCCVRDAMRELCSSFYGKTVMENKDPNVEGICKEYAGKPDDVADCPKTTNQPVACCGNFSESISSRSTERQRKRIEKTIGRGTESATGRGTDTTSKNAFDEFTRQTQQTYHHHRH
ncbi:mucin-associated surface protein (MASP) [Trypanosoma cruzi]|nr:mucin-associated surface protein (MASP) [Trypanosoma cruzi]